MKRLSHICIDISSIIFLFPLLLSGHRESCTHFPAQRRIGFGLISTRCSQQRCKRNLQTSSKARCPDTSLNEETAGREKRKCRPHSPAAASSPPRQCWSLTKALIQTVFVGLTIQSLLFLRTVTAGIVFVCVDKWFIFLLFWMNNLRLAKALVRVQFKGKNKKK